MRRIYLCLICWCFIYPVVGFAEQAPSGAEFEQRLKNLETELRCLVCQNQTLADSSAGLAEDLRKEVRTLAEQGKSNDEIKQFLTTRYGDFVLYNPPVKRITWLLWFGPFMLLAAGAGIFFFIVSRRSKAVDEPALSDAERKKTEDLLS
jgi:cytochrome c-type biogenesis protein CcmH